MMKCSQCFFASIVIALTTLSAEAQIFWQGTAFGDSVADVRSKIAGITSTKTGPEDYFYTEKAFSTAKIEDGIFNVQFFFTFDGLVAVTIFQPHVEQAVADREFRTMAKNVGLACKRQPKGRSTESWITWHCGDTSVHLQPQGGTKPGSANLALSYRLTDDVEARIKAKRPSPYIGMSTKEAVQQTCWGAPLYINRSRDGSGSREQFVYDNNRYLYFNDDKLVSIQD